MGDPGTTAALYSARPDIWLDGAFDADLTSGLLTLMVEETTAGLFRCEATIGNWGASNGSADFLYMDRQVLDFGKPFSVVAGSGEASGQLFSGFITGLEARYPQTRPPEMVVLAEDRLQDLRMTRRTRTFDDVSTSDVINSIASEHSLQTEIDLSGPTYRVLAQVNQSDLAFLRERARAIDAEVWVEDGTLYAQGRSQRYRGDVSITYGQGLRELTILADVATQRTNLTVSGWDVSAKEEVSYEAAEGAISAELNGFESGSQVLQSAFGARPERIVHLSPFNQEEAQALAEANFRSMARQFVKGRGVAEGDARMRVGTHVDLQGLGALFNGEYYITQVRHTFEMADGFRTHFSVERAGLGSA